MSREAVEAGQLARLRALVERLLGSNAFYQRKWEAAGVSAAPPSLEAFARAFPFTTKAELVADREAHPPYGSNLTYPLAKYPRLCQTSGTRGKPLAWLDTTESWSAMLDCWEAIYRAAGVEPGRDRIFFAFSFGPFLGFWTAYEAAARMGCLTIPGGGMSSTGRLACMEAHQATVLCCTPTYALRLGAVRESAGTVHSVRKIIVAGEPGGSIPATRQRIEALWPGARVYDHHGMTEVGPVSYPMEDGADLGVLEDYYLAEILDRDTGAEVDEGGRGELVLTPLRRDGCPLVRYRTGDLVEKAFRGDHLVLAGGILGRIDDMVVVRGVNIYPSAVEGVLRQFPDVAEFQVVQSTRDDMAEIVVEVEGGDPAAIEERLSDSLGLRVPVLAVGTGTLPRYEFKASRWKYEG